MKRRIAWGTCALDEIELVYEKAEENTAIADQLEQLELQALNEAKANIGNVWECDQSCVSNIRQVLTRESRKSCVSNIRQVLTRESRMVSPNLCPRPLSRYDHGVDFMPAFFFVFYYISFFVTVHDPELIDD